MATIDSILGDALALPPADRGRLRLIDSLDEGEEDPTAKDAWAAVIVRRIAIWRPVAGPSSTGRLRSPRRARSPGVGGGVTDAPGLPGGRDDGPSLTLGVLRASRRLRPGASLTLGGLNRFAPPRPGPRSRSGV